MTKWLIFDFIKWWEEKPVKLCCMPDYRELKQPRRRRRQKPHKFAYLTMKNSIFARFARAFFIFWHFEDVLVLSTTWNDLFCSCVDDVSIWWQMFNFVFLCPEKREVTFSDDVLAFVDVVFASAPYLHFVTAKRIYSTRTDHSYGLRFTLINFLVAAVFRSWRLQTFILFVVCALLSVFLLAFFFKLWMS